MKIQLILFFISYIFCKNSFAIPTGGGEAYLAETNKRQAPDFGSDVVITKANCNQRERNGEKTVYDCYDGQQSQQVDSRFSGYPDAEVQTSISSYIQPPEPSQLYEQPPPIPEASSSLGYASASNSGSFQSSEITKANCVTTTDGFVQENGKAVHKLVLICKGGQLTGNLFGPKRNSKRKHGPTYLPKTKKSI